jgi:hypothetical protein
MQPRGLHRVQLYGNKTTSSDGAQQRTKIVSSKNVHYPAECSVNHQHASSAVLVILSMHPMVWPDATLFWQLVEGLALACNAQ